MSEESSANYVDWDHLKSGWKELSKLSASARRQIVDILEQMNTDGFFSFQEVDPTSFHRIDGADPPGWSLYRYKRDLPRERQKLRVWLALHQYLHPQPNHRIYVLGVNVKKEPKVLRADIEKYQKRLQSLVEHLTSDKQRM